MDFKLFLCLCFFIHSSVAVFSSNSKVIPLNSNNFQKKVIKSNKPFFVKFYAPWCGHCQRLAPEWDKLATALDGIVGIGGADMEADKNVGSAYGIRGFPTLKFFASDKSKPIDYNGGRTFNEMFNFAIEQTKKMAMARVNKRAGGSQKSKSSSSNSGGNNNGDAVVVLEEGNFEDLVMKSDEPWFVEFYAPWCGHCKNLAPTWDKIAVTLKGKVKVAKVDSTVEKSLAGRFGVQGYPTLKFFPGGKKSDSSVVDYEGGRDESSLVEWALQQAQASIPALFGQLTSQAVFDEYCVNQKACIIAFLPHIYDTTAKERSAVLKYIEEAAERSKGTPISFLWTQGGDHFNLEESLALGSGYPAVIGLSAKKKVYATLKGAVNKKNFDTFVVGLSTGRESYVPFRELPKIKKTTEWDGKDKQPPKYDDEL